MLGLCLPISPTGVRLLWSSQVRRRRWLSMGQCTLGLVAMFVPFEARCGVSLSSENSRREMTVSKVSPAQSGSLLVAYFRDFLDKGDVDEFRNRVSARYSEATLGRILMASPDVSARRAAVLGLAILGTFQHSNAVLGRALRDDDVAVRSMAEDALWAVWFRADSPEHNRVLDQVRHLIGRGELEQAEKMVTRLISDSPNFAEAYNQRAIIYFIQGRLAESAQDCLQVIERNPFHIGAIEGLARCQLGLKRSQDALNSLRRALKLRPHNAGLRETIHELEAQND